MVINNTLINHNCPVDGEIMIEKDKPCNWCGKIEPYLELVDDREAKAITH